MSTNSGPLEVKVCIIGDTDVGKTSLSMRYCHGEFPENATPTIGASFLQRRVAVEGTEISLQIWDTAGQERFRSMAPMVILVFLKLPHVRVSNHFLSCCTNVSEIVF